MPDDKEFLSMAAEFAALSEEPVGCGCVLFSETRGMLSMQANSQRQDGVAVHHAEMKAVMMANLVTASRKLPETTAYCSCEPCAMCLVALSLAEVRRIVYTHRMRDLFPDDKMAQLDSAAFVAGLNFTPELVWAGK